MKHHYLIIVPGIPAWTPICKLLTYHWKLFGFAVYVVDIHWITQPNDFQSKLQKLVKLVDVYLQQGEVSLLGISAGGSAVLNTFHERRNKIHKVITICGRCRKDKGQLSSGMKRSKAFEQSVELFEQVEKKLSNNEKKKLLTVNGYYDIPKTSSVIPNARYLLLPMGFHAPIIVSALTFFSILLAKFLLE